MPVLGPAIKEVTISASSNPSLRLSYWDENAYVSEFIVSEAPPASVAKESQGDEKRHVTVPEQEGLAGTVTEETKSKKRKAESEKASDKKKVCTRLRGFKSCC